MKRRRIPVPGLFWGTYPQKKVTPRTRWQHFADWGHALVDLGADRLRRGPSAQAVEFLRLVRTEQAALEGVSSVALFDAVNAARLALSTHGLTPAAMASGFAVVCVMAQRCMGLVPFDTQLLAAKIVLDQQLAEMATGEGKSLTVALAAATAAMTGAPVHVVTVNDYLVERDAEKFYSLYSALGLTVGKVIQAHSPFERQQGYSCSLTYVTAKELVFDYLRDRLSDLGAVGSAATESPKVLRGLCMAIVDEADSVLIDEARVPLILAREQSAEDAAMCKSNSMLALSLARTLARAAHFSIQGESNQVVLTQAGQSLIQTMCQAHGSVWRNRVYREHAVCTALSALYVFERDRHYLVRDGEVQIIDELTGRVAPGRAWSNGLHQMVEAKEGCELTGQQTTLAQLTYQRFFRRYFCLGGLSGTVCDARAELRALYGLTVRTIALRRPCRRQRGATRLFASNTALWSAVAQRVRVLHGQGRPVLLATDSVADAEQLSEVLQGHELMHAVLHAHNDRQEAAVVAQAGVRGAITVTTNIAGRGTDIGLGPGVEESGGLHLISCQLNRSRRIDRQLEGRTARQGDPGSFEVYLSLETELLSQYWPAWIRHRLAHFAGRIPSWFVNCLARLPQSSTEAHERLERKRLAQRDEHREASLSFAGRGE